VNASPSTCAECRLLLGGYVLDALEPDEVDTVERHLEVCAECAREREEIATLPTLLDYASAADVALPEPPATLEEAVLDRFAREHRAQRRRASTALRDRLRASLSRIARPLPASAVGALAAGALALTIALATGGGARGETFHAHLTGSPTAPAATANAHLVTSPDGTHVVLRVSGLSADPSSIYEVWCVRNDGAKVSAGTFRVDPHGDANVDLTTAAVPSEYQRMSVERQQETATGWTGQRVLAGAIEYH
jgi:hypothetical protein